MEKALKRLALGLLVLAAVIQFFRPDRTNPPSVPEQEIGAHLKLSPEVRSLLDRSCRDCHSHQTRWPWYSNVAPFSWVLVDDVARGRQELNFSTWGRYTREEQLELLGKICKEVEEGGMPLPSYQLLHPRSRLSRQDVELLCAWARRSESQLTSPSPLGPTGERSGP